MFNRFTSREWSFRIYRETLSRFSCAASGVGGPILLFVRCRWLSVAEVGDIAR
ncbi:hypothetical protein ABLN67_12345 [Mycobacterium tuberculosis]